MASDRQISQLVLQVDANVAVAQRSLQDLARVVNQSAAQMNTSLAANDTAIGRNLTQHHQLGLAFNNARIAQTELTAAVARSVDAYGAGASPLRILQTEMGRLSEAAMFLGGGAGNGILGKVTRFLGGPWGIALLVAGSIIAKLATNHKDAGDSVDALVEKMRSQARQAANSRIADAEWADTIEGLIDRNEKLIDTLQKRLKAEEDVDRQTALNAQHDLEKARQAEDTAKTQRDNLNRQLAIALRDPSLGTNVGGPAEARVEQIRTEIAAAQDAYDQAKKGIGDATKAIVQSQIAMGEEVGHALASNAGAVELWAKRYIEALHGIESANKGALAGSSGIIDSGFFALKKALDDAAGSVGAAKLNAAGAQAKALGNELKNGKLTAQEYADAMKKVAAALEAAAEAAKNAKKGLGFSGKEIGFAEAESIARGAGLQVNSGQRTFAQQKVLWDAWNAAGRPKDNPVAPPGTSAHEGGKGRWALDIQLAPGVTADKIKKLYADQGVEVNVFPERGHLHVSGSTAHATSAQDAAARAAQKQQTDDDQFAKESAQLDAEILQARKSLAAGYDTQAKYADDEIDAQKQALLEAIKKQVDGKQITAAQGKLLAAKVEEVASAKKAVVDQHAYLDALAQSAKAIDQALGFQQDDLRFADDMATTQQDRRKLELAIIDIVYQRKEAELEALKQRIQANADFATSADLQKQAALIQGQIDHLPIEKAQDQSRTNLQTMDPLQAWAQQVPKTAAEINQALQSIEVQGIDNLASSIADVVTGTKSLGAAFKDISREIISEIIQMTVKMLIFKAISAVASAFGGGGGISDPFAGGGGLGGASVDIGSTNFITGARAGGGPVSGGKTYLVGENGPELFSPSTSGMIIPRASKINLSAANNNAPGGEVRLIVELNDDMLQAKIVNGATGVVVQASPRIIQAATSQTARSLSRPRLR